MILGSGIPIYFATNNPLFFQHIQEETFEFSLFMNQKTVFCNKVFLTTSLVLVMAIRLPALTRPHWQRHV